MFLPPLLWKQEKLDIHRFGDRMYCLWESLPPWIQDIEPFAALSYADDPLSWKDTKQTRKIYEKTIYFYLIFFSHQPRKPKLLCST